ncbi:TniQ family protein [Microcoleus sp. F10-B2]
MLSLANLAAELLRHEPAKVDTPRKLRFKKNEPFAFGENESLRGGIARACHLAGVPNSFTVLGELGQRHRNVVAVAEDPNIDETGLAEALDVDLPEIVKRRYPKAMSGKRYFHGLWLPANSIDIRTRRFAPTFLAKEGYHHAAWELKFLPFCPETWDILQSHCNTCKSQA